MKPAQALQDTSNYTTYDTPLHIPDPTEVQGFSHEGPLVWQGIAEMLHHILPELSAMEENLAIFKDIFAQHIRALMRALRIHDDTRVVIGLNESGELHIIHMRHEKAAELEAILTQDDDARNQLAAIALRTKMLTQIGHLDETLNAIMQPPLVAKSYNMCLIGDLSHFYSSDQVAE